MGVWLAQILMAAMYREFGNHKTCRFQEVHISLIEKTILT